MASLGLEGGGDLLGGIGEIGGDGDVALPGDSLSGDGQGRDQTEGGSDDIGSFHELSSWFNRWQ
jgi:hypothetical protein